MARSGLSSTLTLAIVIFSPSSVESSVRIGAMALHGPHHSAQKSTMTGWSEPATVSSKVAVERLTIPAMVAASFGSLACSAGVVYGRCNGATGDLIPTRSQLRTRTSVRGVGDGMVGRLEPALSVDGRHAARPGGGDRLPVRVVLHVAAREHALDVGVRRAGGRDQVAVLVHVQ